jgi:hypothetical protein
MGRNQSPKANMRGAVSKGEITGGSKANARQMAQTNSKNAGDLNYYESTGSVGKSQDDTSAINTLSTDAVNNNIDADKLPPSYENSAGTAPPNANSINHG